ncbi:MAG: acetyl-CoA C-acetyltransferase [Proteobacteria bacterium]|nr:acetyl-CoA C-acetyltransferase [Pseudomonadota bacterium]MBK9250808.1 acetyl-CoA C-acetyltransferase [Pseudomonadota bacterium]
MSEVFIVAARRTAIGKFQGALGNIAAADLGATVIRAVLAGTALQPQDIDRVVLGHVLTAGAGQNTARQAALRAGLPVEVPATTVNMVCGSGLESVQLGAQAIRLGEAQLVLAGGMESMSLAPYCLPKARAGLRMGHATLVDTMISDGLWDAFGDCHMGITAENLARRHGIGRDDQDAYALQSQQRAIAAQDAGRFEAEITPVDLPVKGGQTQPFLIDEQPRRDVQLASLTGLRAAFDKSGSVTAGNSSTLNDGAAALLLASEAAVRKHNLPVLGRVAASASAGVDPAYMGEGPVPASRHCLQKAGWTKDSLDLVEANEAFAVQALTVLRQLELDPARVNVNGGAIALGHPIGASGARILVTLLHEMGRRKVARGLATLCVGGGQGIALAVERS